MFLSIKVVSVESKGRQSLESYQFFIIIIVCSLRFNGTIYSVFFPLQNAIFSDTFRVWDPVGGLNVRCFDPPL